MQIYIRNNWSESNLLQHEALFFTQNTWFDAIFHVKILFNWCPSYFGDHMLHLVDDFNYLMIFLLRTSWLTLNESFYGTH